MVVTHHRDDSEAAIYEAANRFVLDVGAVLLEKRARAPKGWAQWVASSTPFSLDVADRIVAVTLAQAMGDMAPEPWTALG